LGWVGNEIDFPGDDQGWTLSTDSTKYTGPDGSTEWFKYDLIATGTNVNYEFKMVVGNDWVQDFGGNVGFRKDQTDILFYQPSGDTAARLQGGTTAGKHYRFQIKNPGLSNSFPAIMETSSAPVGITLSGRNASSGIISVRLSSPPSPEEKVYVRYSNDGFQTSEFLRCSVSGISATTRIPDLRSGATYQWYSFTSTAEEHRFHNGYATDALTLAWDNNGGANYSFTTPNDLTAVVVNGVPQDYTTTKFFIDEIAAESFDVIVDATFSTPPFEAQVVTNLNNRDRVDSDDNADGIPDGILPATRDSSTIGGTGYFEAYPLISGTGASWSAVIPASKTGTYRVTVRYRQSPTGEWYYTNARDHAVVVSPRKTLDMTLYELNALTVEAQAPTQAGRSTFQDLLSAAEGDTDGYDPFSLQYLDSIQANCLWFQPIHPTGADGVENDPATGSPYMPGSPYATKDFFAVNPHMGSANTSASALAEFQNFVAKCDAHTGAPGTLGQMGAIHVMLDYVANHSSWDAVYGQGGVDLNLTGNPNQKIPASYYSHRDDYGVEATFYTSSANTDIAPGPDRFDFGKWNDVSDLFYGRYSALWRYASDSGLSPQPHNNEDDYFDYASLSPEVINLWKLIGYYPEFWLGQTGHSLTNSTTGSPSARQLADDVGIDALRCDFGQGLPNPLWEYIVNRTRSKKWNFVFMAETLDGGSPGYRSNRVFDILNENMVFQYTQANVNDESVFESEQENRRNTYRTGAILHNLTSHDEIMADNDPWVVATRYAMVNTLHGLPMVFYGQEKGIQNYNTTNPTYDGFTDHELNFGKWVPHFKRWNQLSVWNSPPPFATGLDQWYGYVNQARLHSPALRGLDQWYLSAMGGAPHNQLWAIAKSEKGYTSPAFTDVVLGFANLFQHGAAHASQSNVIDLFPAWSFLGMDVGRQYNVRNLASSNPNAFLWGSPMSGATLRTGGIFVLLGGGTSAAITDDHELVQYLKVVDVTPPPAPDPIPMPGFFTTNTSVTFDWLPPGGAHDNITHYVLSIGTTQGGSDVVSSVMIPFGTNSYTFTGAFGNTYFTSISSVSAAGISSTTTGTSDPALDPASNTTPVIVLDPAGDEDADGQTNGFELVSGNSPLDPEERLDLCVVSANGAVVTLSCSTVPGRNYTLQSTTNLLSGPWVNEDEPTNVNQTASGSTLNFTDGNASGARKFYRMKVGP